MPTISAVPGYATKLCLRRTREHGLGREALLFVHECGTPLRGDSLGLVGVSWLDRHTGALDFISVCEWKSSELSINV